MNNAIDTNIHLSRWPFRRLRYDDTSALAEMLRKNGVSQAWAGSFDGLLHRDIAGVNLGLAEECRKYNNLFIPFGSINPTLPDWEEDVRRCHEELKMPGIRLHPNYHDYKLDAPFVDRLLKIAAERQLLVQIAVSMEDRRTQHPLLLVPPVDPMPIVAMVKQIPNVRVMLLNSLNTIRGEPLLRLLATGKIYFEISMLEGIGGVGKLLEQMPLKHLLFGSHSPFYIFESALLKMKESALSNDQSKAILKENAQRLIFSERK